MHEEAHALGTTLSAGVQRDGAAHGLRVNVFTKAGHDFQTRTALLNGRIESFRMEAAR